MAVLILGIVGIYHPLLQLSVTAYLHGWQTSQLEAEVGGKESVAP